MSVHDQPVVPVTGDASHLPAYATEHAAGADLIADIAEALTVLPGERALVPTGLRMAIPVGYEGQVRPRSGLAWKKGLTVLNAPGTIDADYRGEVKVILVNLSRDAAVIEPGERIAQMVIAAVPKAIFRQVEELPGTERGEGGFGSTGT